MVDIYNIFDVNMYGKVLMIGLLFIKNGIYDMS